MMENKTLDNLKKAVLEYNSETATNWARKAINENIDPMTVMDALIDAISQVGDAFEEGDLFLPELVGAAEALQKATPIVEEAIKSTGKTREFLGTVAIGTVCGDIHTIGKSMVVSLLTAGGFEVHDLGINVPTERFTETVKTLEPDVLGMSALLTTTAPEAKKVIQTLKTEGLRDKVKIMVGGGAITQEFADSIGADGYRPTAPGAVILARTFLGI